MAAKSICLFNHKGGVSKTTSTFNIGWALASMGKKVLMVDLDSQCNLSGLILNFVFLDDKEISYLYSSRDNLTLAPIVEAIKMGGRPDVVISDDRGKVIKTLNDNLF